MFIFALIVSLVCLAVPAGILRMLATRRRTIAQIHAVMSEHRRTCCRHRTEQQTEVTS
ncbi:hypothetical protein [Microbispora sp. GKU 823]|uniref:hypothetical protein n=1 Tax=Microbispora sp. GKU 823 TaxID=1652100 RepID=UPI0015C49323|nr:hypothetical protein [Microbispora sp. GKU 823]